MRWLELEYPRSRPHKKDMLGVGSSKEGSVQMNPYVARATGWMRETCMGTDLPGETNMASQTC